jgi:hypothetical protein
MLSIDTKKRLLQLLAISIALLLVFIASLAPANATAPEKDASTPVVKPDPMTEKWGIEIIWVKQTANGRMLDFRYRVLDTAKAAPLFRRQTKPYLVDQASDAKLTVHRSVKVGSMRTSVPPQANRNYFMLFTNPGGFVKAGNKVTVVIGDFKAENLVVE